MTANIAPLAYRELPRIRYEAMLVLQQNLGLQASRDVIERAVVELSDRLCKLELALYDRDFDAVQTLSVSLIAISTQIGLTEFADVASDLVFCIDCQEMTATHAVAARLLRLGESSMFEAAQFAELTGG
jgi:hypothetical protein